MAVVMKGGNPTMRIVMRIKDFLDATYDPDDGKGVEIEALVHTLATDAVVADFQAMIDAREKKLRKLKGAA